MSRLVPCAAPAARRPAPPAAAEATDTSAPSGALDIRIHPAPAPAESLIRVREVAPAVPPCTDDADVVLAHESYRIRIVRTREQRRYASALIARMYARRGYDAQVPSAVEPRKDSVTFGAYLTHRFCGTLTLGFDGEGGLLADTLYRPEIDRFRERGYRVCELSRFAIDPEYSSKGLLASLFQAACKHAVAAGSDVAVIEVNPRHTAFYRRILGFRQAGDVRTCPRVNAPAALLHVPVQYVADQLRHYAASAAAIDTAGGGLSSERAAA